LIILIIIIISGLRYGLGSVFFNSVYSCPWSLAPWNCSPCISRLHVFHGSAYFGAYIIFPYFLLQVHCNEKLCQNFNFGVNRMKIDLFRLKLRFLGLNYFSIFFLLPAYCNNKFCVDFYIGVNRMKIDPYRLKQGFYRPKSRVLGFKLFFHIFLLPPYYNNKFCLDFYFVKNMV
jgi:hypothetical protein